MRFALCLFLVPAALFGQSIDEHLAKQKAMLEILRAEMPPAVTADITQAVTTMNERGKNLRGLAAVHYQLGCSSCAQQGMQQQGDCASGQCSMQQQRAKPDS